MSWLTKIWTKGIIWWKITSIRCWKVITRNSRVVCSCLQKRFRLSSKLKFSTKTLVPLETLPIIDPLGVENFLKKPFPTHIQKKMRTIRISPTQVKSQRTKNLTNPKSRGLLIWLFHKEPLEFCQETTRTSSFWSSTRQWGTVSKTHTNSTFHQSTSATSSSAWKKRWMESLST